MVQLYSYMVPGDLIGLEWTRIENGACVVIYAHHADDDAPASPSFSVLMVL